MNQLTPVGRTAHIEADLDRLTRDGYLILRHAIDDETLAVLCTDLDPCFAQSSFCRGAFYGETTKRFGRVLARSAAAASLALHPHVLRLVRRALGAEAGVQLNLSQAIEIHPGAPVQPPHRDHDMWGCVKEAGRTYMVNVMWSLDAFTAENGATRLWPGSNQAQADDAFPDETAAVAAVAPPGSAILFLGQTLHAGGANRSMSPRRGLIFSYCLDWLLPDENPWLAYPPEVARSFPPALASMVGYRQRYAGLNNFEGQDPALLLGDSVADYLAFTDAMSPDQAALIERYYAEQRPECFG